MSTLEGQNMQTTSSQQTIRRIVRSWSSTLELDQTSGESIVTQSDLDRLTQVFLHRFDTNRSNNSATAVLDSTDTSILPTQMLHTQVLNTPQ